MMKRTNETGRSMVEMLGVLAIIGVLSVGGIAGYTLAMNRYRANEIIDMANKFAVVSFAARETYATMHNGTVDDNFHTPTFANSGLGTGDDNVNGATFGDLEYFSDATCSTAAVANTAAMSVRIPITLPSPAVCKAAASTLGLEAVCTEENRTLNFCSRNS